jgi:hypothetical protein
MIHAQRNKNQNEEIKLEIQRQGSGYPTAKQNHTA